jgi:vacuolar-type H+-ATPase catalytic subunit A/Vma1
MASKPNRISITAFKEAVKSKIDNSVRIEWNGLDVEIKKSLSLEEMLDFVAKAVEICFGNDNAYHPEKLDFAIRVLVVENYSNITLPSDIDTTYDSLYQTDIIETILASVNQSQYDVMISAIKEQVRQINSVRVSNLENQLNNVCTTVDNLQQQMEEIFSGIDSNTMSQLVGAMANMNIDEAKLAKAIVGERGRVES